MARNRRRGFGQYLTRRVWAGLAAIGLALVAGLALYIGILDRQIVHQFEGRRWDVPAQVYARPLEIYAGVRLTPDNLEEELVALGYSKDPKAQGQGTYSRSGNQITLVSRPFQFWDGAETSHRARILFGNGVVTSLTGAGNQDLPLLRLDPLLIGNIFSTHTEDRIVLRPDAVPPLLLKGLKIVEDRDFDRHGGISLKAIARAMWANLRAGGIEQGGSTLTQQLVRSYFLNNNRTLTRKIHEALMSILLEEHFDKADILNAYVNEIYLGQAGNRAIHGFGLASQFYFGKPLAELKPAQIALLIAVVRGPSYYDPRRHPDRARQRRDMVLDLMAEFGALDKPEATRAKAQPLGVRGGAASFASYNPTFMDLVRRELQADYQEDDLKNAGLRIMTTLDPRIQAQAERRLAEGLAEIERSRRMPAGTLDGAIVVAGAQTPDIVAIVGGRNARLQGFNRALDAKRPIGSVAKPMVYLAGFETGDYTPASTLMDTPITVKLDTGATWDPQNYDRQYRGPVSATRALAESLNVPTVQLGMAVGPKRVAAVMQSMGLEKAPRPLPSLLLGSVALAPIEVAQLYNSLANGGFRTPLKAVRAVLDSNGKPLERYQLKINRAAEPAAVQEVDSILVQVFERGTARGARAWLPPGLTVAGKTGTTDDLRDSWFAGFSNDHVAVVWVGADDNAPTGLTGASGALPIWARMVADFGDSSYTPLPVAGLQYVSFDFATGMSAGPGCGDPVILPLPTGTVVPPNPLCDGGIDFSHVGDVARQGVEWLRKMLN